MNSYKKSRILILVLCSLSLSVAACKKKKDLFGEPIISVEQKTLTGFDFSNLLVRKFNEQDIKYPKPDVVAILKKQIIEDFIIQTIYENFASEKNIFVKKDDLDKAFNQLRNSYPDPESFEIFINESGLKISDVRTSVKQRLIRQLSQAEILKEFKANITDDEIKDFYNNNKDRFSREKQLRLKQILVEHEEEALKLQDLLNETGQKNFETLAKKHSLSPEKIDGGDLGWVNISSSIAFKKAEQTANGRISPVIKSPNGYHIFKVIERRNPYTYSLKEATPEIVKLLETGRKEQFIANWIKEESKKSDIKINDDLLSKIVVNRPSSY